MTRLRPGSVLAAAAVAVALPAAGQFLTNSSYYAGPLSAGRNDTLSCTATHSVAGSPSLLINLFAVGATDPMATETCFNLAPHESCAVSTKNPSPIPVEAFCVVASDAFSRVTGNLRVDDPVHKSTVSADLFALSESP